ncbi:MAG: LysR family transcriptional regulator [Alphaproteobacteria bacterium]|nr:LysR family transcriptional regulator [Alphaproteobacteria bacterium]
MIRNLDTSLLRAFAAVAGTGNMTASAAKLGLTQGAVSQQIRRLEETLQCALFDRSRRGLKLTKRGEQLLGPSRQLLELNDEIWNEMTAPPMRGEVRLGIPYDLITTYLPLVLEGFVEANPQIEVSLVSAASPELLDAMKKGEVDLALVEEPLDSTGGECLCVERLLWIGRKDGTAFQKRPLPLSIVDETCAFRPSIVTALEQTGMPWRSVFENGNIEATMTTVRADLAVTASLASLVPDDLEVLSRATGLPDLPSFAINLYLRDIDPGPAINELASFLRDGIVARSRGR